MFDQQVAELEAAIEALEVPVEGRAIRTVLALADRLTAKAIATMGAFGAGGGHQAKGALTVAAWLRHHVGLDHAAAARLARRATKLHRLPLLQRAFEAGSLGRGAVDTILSHVPNRHLERFAEHEAELVPSLLGLDRREPTVAMQAWLTRADALDPGPPPHERPDTLYFARTLGDRALVHADLGADATVVAAALRVVDSRDLYVPVPERQAQALGQICQEFLDHHGRPATGTRHRPHVNVTITAEQWAGERGAPPARDLDTDLPVSAAATAVLRCDAIVHAFVHDEHGAVLHYGRGTRTWPRAVVNAIIVRDQGCRWPGCTAPARWCDVHHAVPWEEGGTTAVDNGLLLCRRHHHLLHRHVGWHLKLCTDSTVELTHPTGETETSRPRARIPPSPVPANTS